MTNPNYPYGDPDNTGGTPDYGSYGGGQNNSGGGAGPFDPSSTGQPSGSYPGSTSGGFHDPYNSGYTGGFENSPMNAKKNKLAAWALGLGIASIAVFLTMFAGPLAILLLAAPFIAVAGIIVAIVALLKGKKYQGSNKRTGWSVGGLILSIISLLIMVFFTVVAVAFLNSGIVDCFIDYSDATSQQACIEGFMNENS